AEKALSEFASKKRSTTMATRANTSGAAADLKKFGSGVKPITVKTKIEDATTRKTRRGLEINANILRLQGALSRGSMNHTGRSSLESQLYNLTRLYASGKY